MTVARPRLLSPLANSSSLLVGEGGAKLLGLATMLYVIRVVDLEMFGFSALALAIVGYVDAAFLRGAEIEGVRRLSPWPANATAVARPDLNKPRAWERDQVGAAGERLPEPREEAVR